MDKVHPNARKLAENCKLSIDEGTGALELNGHYNTAVIVNLKGLKSTAEPPKHVVYLPSRVPGEAIAFLSHDVEKHLKFNFVKFETRLSMEQWDWSAANLPEVWEIGPEPWRWISEYIAELYHAELWRRFNG